MQNKITSIAVYCASSPGNKEQYMKTAFDLGKAITEKGKTLIYGGARVGLMGAVADGGLAGKGKVIGVIPTFLTVKELQHDYITETYEVETMHQRKAKMIELADAFIALPGGFGTMEELFEVMTWGQLALHKKPIGILNLDGFYDPFFDFIEGMISRGFLKEEYRNLVVVDTDIEKLIEKIENYVPFKNDKWFNVEIK